MAINFVILLFGNIDKLARRSAIENFLKTLCFLCNNGSPIDTPLNQMIIYYLYFINRYSIITTNTSQCHFTCICILYTYLMPSVVLYAIHKQCENNVCTMKTHINLLIICFVIKLQTTIISCSINAVISKYFSESCGSIDSQVIYQTKAKIGETPWIAAIRSQNNGIEYVDKCFPMY